MAIEGFASSIFIRRIYRTSQKYKQVLEWSDRSEAMKQSAPRVKRGNNRSVPFGKTCPCKSPRRCNRERRIQLLDVDLQIDFNMTPDEILEALKGYKSELQGILGRFTRDRNGIHIETQDNYRLRTIATELLDLLRDHVPGSGQHIRLIASSFNEGISNLYHSSSYASVEEIKGVVAAVATRIERNRSLFVETTNPILTAPDQRKLLDALDQLVLRFHPVAVQLRDRHDGRPSLDVNDEYDVQDLMHALLRLHFDDVRPEEWVPSYAGSSSRTDFLLPQIDTVVEIKKTRQGLNAKAVGEQLIVDIAKYRKHPQCRRLVCFVYDPEGRIANPAGIENDLNSGDHGIEVNVSILPKLG